MQLGSWEEKSVTAAAVTAGAFTGVSMSMGID
jgi:hypothetical protein